MTPNPDLAEFDRRRDELLEKRRKERWSGRVVLYLDLRFGEVVEAGEVNPVRPWIERENQAR